jgi:hypothetical protein
MEPGAMHCSQTTACELFPKFSIPALKGALKVWKNYYCEARWENCVRFKLAAEGKPIPPALLPNGKLVDAALAPWMGIRQES